MTLSAPIDRVVFYDEGVSYSYLVLKFDIQGQEQCCLRALNYLPDEPNQTEVILERFNLELKELGVSAQNTQALGGGSITRNPYYETISLFGSNATYGAEADRAESSKWIEAALPEATVTWHPPEVEKPTPKKSPPAKKTDVAQKVASQESST